MISPTCCSKALVVALCLLANIATAHSVHGGRNHELLDSNSEGTQDSVDNLIQRYSLTGNDELLERGWALIDAELKSAQPRSRTLLSAAWLAQASHQFPLAQEFLGSILQVEPTNGQAWMLMASTAMAQGDSRSARAACRQLVLTVSPIVALACSARLLTVTAEQQLAYEKLSRIPVHSLETSLQSWVYSILGDLAASLKNWPASVEWYELSIARYPAVQTRAALLDSLLAQNHHKEVLTAVDASNPVPALAVRRLLAEKSLGVDVAATKQLLDERFSQWIEAGDYRHAREMALFYLEIAEQPKIAYQLASKNATLQKEKEDWTLLARTELALAKQKHE